ncbi:DUF6985 domain-containing protein [Larkinella punicea]|nr:hypothetical protein [Larkinella punicea]
MESNETYDLWHRRQYPSQYIWESYLFPAYGITDSSCQCGVNLKIFGCNKCHFQAQGTTLNQEQIKTVTTLVEKQQSFVDDIRKSIFEYYQFIWNDYGHYMDDTTKYPLIQLNEVYKIDDLIKLKSLHCPEKMKEGTFGLCFSCTFDEEHGLGIRFKEYKIAEIGGEDVGFGQFHWNPI